MKNFGFILLNAHMLKRHGWPFRKKFFFQDTFPFGTHFLVIHCTYRQCSIFLECTMYKYFYNFCKNVIFTKILISFTCVQFMLKFVKHDIYQFLHFNIFYMICFIFIFIKWDAKLCPASRITNPLAHQR